MFNLMPARLRAPATMLAGGAIITAAVAATNGWVALLYLGPLTLAAAAGYYVLAGRGSDFAAMLRAETDERQHHRRLEIQALVGRVTAGAAAAAYVAAVAAKATLWPFAIFLAVPTGAFILGWLVYRERADGRDG
jgi:hypothetical protein